MFEKLFNNVLDAVSVISGYSKAEIISRSRSSDLVDIRSLMYYVLRKEGMYPSSIARFMKRSAANIRDLINDYSRRAENNKYLRTIKSEIDKKLASYCYA